MPIPTPTKNEAEGDFVSRCISSISDEYDPKQAAAICHGQWDDKKKVKKTGCSDIIAYLGLSPAAMTLDQAVVAGVVIDDILGMVCGCEFAKAEGAEVPGESVMRSMLLVQWGNAEEVAATAALNKLAAGAGTLTEGELASIFNLVDDTLQAEFVDPVAGKLPAVMTRWYRRAKKEVLTAHSLDLIWEEIDQKATAWLADHHMYWVGNYYDKHLSGALAAHVTEGMKAGLGRTAIGEELQTFFKDYPGVQNKPLSYWRGFAANGMNRTRQFGLIQSWQDVGVTELEILAVMDERTSDICRELNGNIIPVSRCAGQRDQLMAAENPEDVKTIAPWPTLESIQNVGTNNIMNQGVVTPPYHFNCRTTLVER